MVNAQTTPALPWGDTSREAATDATSQRPLSMQTVNVDAHNRDNSVEHLPDVGSKIEVKWQIEEDDNIESLWWPATVQSVEPTTSHETDAEASAILRYEAFRDFEAETAEVELLSQGRLYHKDNKEAVLRWRRPGELQSDTDEDEGDMLLDANDLNQDEQELERELGVSAEDIMREQLQRYPMDQQRQLASGARAFVEHFREHLGQLAQAQGGSYTVTENDVQGIFSSLRRQ